MAVSSEFEEYVAEQFGAAGHVEPRRMFGGVGFYIDGVFCALISSGGRVFLRIDDTNRDDFEAEGMKPFQPRTTGGSMPYYEVPARVLEHRDDLRIWALKARAAAEASSNRSRPVKRKKKAAASRSAAKGAKKRGAKGAKKRGAKAARRP